MNVNALRTWGIGATTALMVAALLIERMPETAHAAPAPLAGQFEIAQAAPAQAAPLSFLVRFRGDGPIARSQASAARGNDAAAAREIRAQLARQSAFAGLCFDRFTVGAAEVVLVTCDPVAAGQRAETQSRWVSRLRAMRAVAYADVNATAGQNRAG